MSDFGNIAKIMKFSVVLHTFQNDTSYPQALWLCMVFVMLLEGD